jgi:hypothetical protein
LFQKAAVLSLEYSAATILILLTGAPPPPDPPAVPAPVPPLHAVSASGPALQVEPLPYPLLADI